MIKEALEIDETTEMDYWWKAIQKEMKKMMVAFDVDEDWTLEQIREGLAHGDYVGFQEIECHWVFDIKMDLTHHARFVARGHTTEPPATMTYSSVVSQESVQIAFLVAALNDLDVQCCDIGNAFLNAPCQEKIWFVAGPEFGSKQGQPVKVVRALYGLKSSSAAWRNMLSEMIQDMGFKPCKGDPDVYRREATKLNGFKYYEYLLTYVDDILIVSHNPKPILELLGNRYDLKPDSIGPPEQYLGANIEKYQIIGDDTGCEYWSMSPKQYVQEAICNVKELLKEEDRTLKSKVKMPFPSGYKPELDMTDELDDDKASRFQQLIGVLHWAIELSRVDILYEVSVLLQYLAMP